MSGKRKTRAELAAEIEKLQKEHDESPEDDDQEHDDDAGGSTVTLTHLRGAEAKRWLRSLGLSEEEIRDTKRVAVAEVETADGETAAEVEVEAEAGGESEAEKEPPKDPKPATKHRYFR